MKGKKWEDLKKTLKDIFEKISKLSIKNVISIVNFSATSIIDTKLSDPKDFSLSNLTILGNGTNFSLPFKDLKTLLIEDNWKEDTVAIFMSDGEANFPKIEIEEINLIVSKTFINRKFKFYAIGFKCKNNLIEDIAKALNGETSFAVNGEELRQRYFEIFTKSIK